MRLPKIAHFLNLHLVAIQVKPYWLWLPFWLINYCYSDWLILHKLLNYLKVLSLVSFYYFFHYFVAQVINFLRHCYLINL